MARDPLSKVAVALALSVLASGAHAGSVGTGITIQVNPQALVLAVTPNRPQIACEIPAGTTVAQAAAAGGNGNPITFTMTGPVAVATDFTVDPQSGAVKVGANGVTLANCGKSFGMTVTATQP
jgi:hypothetical protein